MTAAPIAFWDIDGTLLNCPSGLGDRHEMAVRRVRVDVVSGHHRRPGCTDFEVILAKTRDIPGWSSTDSAVALRALEDITKCDLVRHPCQRVVGAVESLTWVSALGWSNALLTGNTRERALAKLESAAMADFFDLELSVFGDHARTRTHLARSASNCVERIGAPAAVVFGDTPLDVQAANSVGLKVVAVATGLFPLSQLEDEKPDLAISDLVSGRKRVEEWMCSMVTKS